MKIFVAFLDAPVRLQPNYLSCSTLKVPIYFSTSYKNVKVRAES
jgi:hypothetical protein